MKALNLFFVLIGNSLQRIAAGASCDLVGLYLAQLANRDSAVGAGLVGVFVIQQEHLWYALTTTEKTR